MYVCKLQCYHFFISFHSIFIRDDAGSYQVKVIIRFPIVIEVRQAIIAKETRAIVHCLFAKVTIN
jgi:hypothetical protein